MKRLGYVQIVLAAMGIMVLANGVQAGDGKEETCKTKPKAGCCVAGNKVESPAIGRWDITIHNSEHGTPSWVKIWKEGNEYKGQFCGFVGGVTDAYDVKVTNKAVEFKSHDYSDWGRRWLWTGTVDGDTMTGVYVNDKGENETKWTAVRFVPEVNATGTWQLQPAKAGANSPAFKKIALRQTGDEITGKLFADKVFPVDDAKLKTNQLCLTVDRGEDKNWSISAEIHGDRMVGTITPEGGEATTFQAQRERPWGKPIELIQDDPQKGWKPLGNPNDFRWKVEDGVLSTTGGANIMTENEFKDFKLHLEFKVPKGGNSGVYLRGRYEIQIEDSFGKEPQSGHCGGLYSRLTPPVNASKPAGQWQTYDVTLIGQYLTLEHNGKLLYDNVEIEGITGGALDSHEAKPGPLYLQGDHGEIHYRNIVLTPALPIADPEGVQ